jgi:protein-glutamine gamma-glutamyltransferase
MARTALLAGGLGALIAASWMRLERPRGGLGELVLVTALAVAPAFVPKGRARVAAVVVAALTAASVAFDASPLDLGTLLSRAWKGFLDYYDVLVPFDPSVQPLMHGVALLAVFAFSLAAALAVAARRPAAAILALLAGAGWPATISPGRGGLWLGLVLLAAALVVLAAMREGRMRPVAQAVAGGALVGLAALLSASTAIGKSEFVDWKQWDFYNRPDTPVTVSYIWQANYDGVKFPNKRTRVLRIRASSRATYWRATTLDGFTLGHWVEDLTPAQPERDGPLADLSREPLMPRAAREQRDWTQAEVTVDALSDNHLAAASVPVAYDTGELGSVEYSSGGVAQVSGLLKRGDRYTTWGYAPRPTPAQLERSRPIYPSSIADDGHYLSIEGLSVPPFGAPGRDVQMQEVFANDSFLRSYGPVYERAREVAGRASNPYAAAVALEAWFRSSGGFEYDETPRRSRALPPLVFFVTRSKQGYCQHFAGAMALMLRSLGIPARVAAGFTSGTYEPDRRVWNVTDRNAHTWVEVWFRGFGWLPFDPTPGRGNLSGAYSSSSFSFDAPGARRVLAAGIGAVAADRLLRFQLNKGSPDANRGAPAGRQRDAENGGGNGHISAVQVLLLAFVAGLLLVAAAKLAIRRRRYLTRDPRRLASACRRELVELLADQRIDVPPAATLGELRSVVLDETGVETRRLVASLGLARFGPEAEAPSAARLARAELRAVRRRLRTAFSAGERLRGTFSLRSVLVR